MPSKSQYPKTEGEGGKPQEGKQVFQAGFEHPKDTAGLAGGYTHIRSFYRLDVRVVGVMEVKEPAERELTYFLRGGKNIPRVFAFYTRNAKSSK